MKLVMAYLFLISSHLEEVQEIGEDELNKFRSSNSESQIFLTDLESVVITALSVKAF